MAIEQQLPGSRVVLKELFRTCANSLDILERVVQRDKRRFDLMVRFADGEISFDELQRHGKVLADAAENARNEYRPLVESLWPYCDRILVAKAKLWLTMGGEAVADGHAWIAHNPCFANMIAAGAAIAVRGQMLHVSLLRNLQREIVDAIRNLAPIEPEKPEWNPIKGRLLYRNKLVRKVRGDSVAKRIRAILDAFQAAGWPDHVPAPPDVDPQTLRESIYTLNEGIIPMDEGSIRFEADGTGYGINCERD